MLVAEPRLERWNEYGFPDPTPATVRWGIVIVTLNELVTAIAETTGEQPRQVEHLVRAWIRDGLLPRPKIVPVPGKRGTRGDYGDACKVGYLVVKALRPKGKPVAVRVFYSSHDKELIRASVHFHAEYHKWVKAELKDNYGGKGPSVEQMIELDEKNLLPIAPATLMAQWREPYERRQAELAEKGPIFHRMRLNKKNLARLIPIARGDKPDEIEDLFLYYNIWDEDVSEELMSEFVQLELDMVQYDLDRRAIQTIWKAVCSVEVGCVPDVVEQREGDVVAYRDKREIWRLSRSRWKAERIN